MDEPDQADDPIDTVKIEHERTLSQEIETKNDDTPVIQNGTEEEELITDDHVKIVDLGNSCFTDRQFTDDVQTRQYRCPEVILGMKYSTPIDIWSAACVAFELATGDYLFNARESSNVPRDEDHLALITELLGEFPQRMKSTGKRWHHFFDKHGRFHHIRSLKFWPLEDVLRGKYRISAEDAKLFTSFLIPMLAIDPNQRATAEQCLKHPFLEDTGTHADHLVQATK
jgi:serine/threonine-protein kinase SRPK3